MKVLNYVFIKTFTSQWFVILAIFLGVNIKSIKKRKQNEALLKEVNPELFEHHYPGTSSASSFKEGCFTCDKDDEREQD